MAHFLERSLALVPFPTPFPVLIHFDEVASLQNNLLVAAERRLMAHALVQGHARRERDACHDACGPLAALSTRQRKAEGGHGKRGREAGQGGFTEPSAQGCALSVGGCGWLGGGLCVPRSILAPSLADLR